MEERNWETDAAMGSGDNEFLRLLCNLYLTALLVALPLYTGEGYWNLGDTKYTLFKNITLLCLGIWLAAELSIGIWRGARRVGRRAAGRSRRPGFGAMDWAVASYGVCVLLSALCSRYGDLAWTGYEGWYMGAVSQLMFVGIYFFVSRRYDGARWPLYLGEAALLAVTALGLLHRLGIDPLKLLVYWNYRNWEYSHMLSTLGNINWLCGYYSVALALAVAHFLWEERRWLRAVLYVAAVLSFVLLGVQGSQGGLLILAVCAAGCFLLGREKPEVLARLWLLLAGFFLCMPLMGLGMELRGDKAAVVADGNVFGYVGWYVWVIAGGACLAVCLWLVKRGPVRGNRGSRMGHPQARAALIGALAVCVAAALFVLLQHGIGDSFGSGRGFLWRIALEGFGQADGKAKLLGAGPDCYGVAVFGRLGAGTDVWKGEHWEGAVFTNAHNELLSQLCNVGILGTLSYLTIFLTGFWRYGRGCMEACRGGPAQSREGRGGQGKAEGRLACPAGEDSCYLWAGLLAIAMYGAHSLISFQQVLNTPLLFLALGICEQKMRARKEVPGTAIDMETDTGKTEKYNHNIENRNMGKRRARP